MKKKQKTSGSKNPTVNLAINKSRIKQYGSGKKVPSYYLERGQEFQLELYNPTQEKVLATIKLNNKFIEGGLVIRPGERVFLDRYLNSNKRFLFDTYLVEDTKSTKIVIEPNGDVEVAFFKEIIKTPTLNQTYTRSMNSTGGVISNYNQTITNVNDFNISSGDVSYTTTALNSTVSFFNPESSVSTYSLGVKGVELDLPKKTKETGRIEEGSESEQQLKLATGEFEITSYHVVKYKLLPKSEQLSTTKEYLTKYCTNCGAKCKTKFCPYCGTKQ